MSSWKFYINNHNVFKIYSWIIWYIARSVWPTTWINAERNRRWPEKPRAARNHVQRETRLRRWNRLKAENVTNNLNKLEMCPITWINAEINRRWPGKANLEPPSSDSDQRSRTWYPIVLRERWPASLSPGLAHVGSRFRPVTSTCLTSFNSRLTSPPMFRSTDHHTWDPDAILVDKLILDQFGGFKRLGCANGQHAHLTFKLRHQHFQSKTQSNG